MLPGLHDLFNNLTGHGRNKKDADGNTELYKAVKQGSIDKVKKLLKAGADPNVLNEHHLSPLHQAAYWGEIEIVELLLKHGARADIDNGRGWTPLHSAAAAGGLKTRGEIIGMLTEKGADMNQRDKHGWTPADYMVLWEQNEAAAEKLKQHMSLHPNDSTTPSKKPHGLHTPKH